MEREEVYKFEQEPVSLADLILTMESWKSIPIEDPIVDGLDYPEGTYIIPISDTFRSQIVEALKRIKLQHDIILARRDNNIASEIVRQIPMHDYAKSQLNNTMGSCHIKTLRYKNIIDNLLTDFEALKKLI